jgi:hypothetical protein
MRMALLFWYIWQLSFHGDYVRCCNIYTPYAGIFLTIGQYTRTHEVQHDNLY